jgi:hypothetical protein
MKRFMYASLAVLALALAVHFGATTAETQSSNEVVSSCSVFFDNGTSYLFAMAPCGDVYRSGDLGSTWYYVGSVFGMGPSKMDETTWSRLKADFR